MGKNIAFYTRSSPFHPPEDCINPKVQNAKEKKRDYGRMKQKSLYQVTLIFPKAVGNGLSGLLQVFQS